MESVWQILKPWDEIKLYVNVVQGKSFFSRPSISPSRASDSYCSKLKVVVPFKINTETHTDNRINKNEHLRMFLLTRSNLLKNLTYPKISINSYTSPTQESPGSSELYLADRRGTRGAAKTREAPFSSWLCHRSTSGYLLLKIHALSSRVPPALSSRARSSRSPPSAQCRLSTGVHLQQSLLWWEISWDIRVYEWLTYKKILVSHSCMLA